jgi:hypothetical protein
MILFGLGSFLLFIFNVNDVPVAPPPVISPPSTWGPGNGSAGGRRQVENHGQTPKGQR